MVFVKGKQKVKFKRYFTSKSLNTSHFIGVRGGTEQILLAPICLRSAIQRTSPERLFYFPFWMNLSAASQVMPKNIVSSQKIHHIQLTWLRKLEIMSCYLFRIFMAFHVFQFQLALF